MNQRDKKSVVVRALFGVAWQDNLQEVVVQLEGTMRDEVVVDGVDEAQRCENDVKRHFGDAPDHSSAPVAPVAALVPPVDVSPRFGEESLDPVQKVERNVDQPVESVHYDAHKVHHKDRHFLQQFDDDDGDEDLESPADDSSGGYSSMTRLFRRCFNGLEVSDVIRRDVGLPGVVPDHRPSAVRDPLHPHHLAFPQCTQPPRPRRVRLPDIKPCGSLIDRRKFPPLHRRPRLCRRHNKENGQQ